MKEIVIQFAMQQTNLLLGIILSVLFFILLIVLISLLFKSEKELSFPSHKKLQDQVSVNQSISEDLKEIDSGSLLEKLKSGLAKTRLKLTSGIEEIFKGKNKLDGDSLESLYEILYQSDIGVSTVDKLIKHVESSIVPDSEYNIDFLKQELCNKSLELTCSIDHGGVSHKNAPHIILVVGVNGAGKTTSIGKLAARYISQGKSVCICAADTYRAAAIEQITVWGQRLNSKVVSHKHGSDPAAVVYDAIKSTKANNFDILIIDTAGRLQNKINLMQELGKINKIISREIPEAPHETLLVVDATTGQNAFSQVKSFKECVKISGVIMTKLDGTAKGGVLIGIIDQFKLPINYVGIGEKISDLRPFEPESFVKNLFI